MQLAAGFVISCRCGCSYSRIDSLETHLASCHLHWEPYHCLYCSERFSGLAQVTDHYFYCHKEEAASNKIPFHYVPDIGMRAELEKLKQEALRDWQDRQNSLRYDDREYTPSLPSLDSRPVSCAPSIELSPEQEEINRKAIQERKFLKLTKNFLTKLDAAEEKEEELPSIFNCNLCEEATYSIQSCQDHTWKHLADEGDFPYFCKMCAFMGDKRTVGRHCYSEHKSPQAVTLNEGVLPLYEEMFRLTFPNVFTIVAEREAQEVEKKLLELERIARERQEKEEEINLRVTEVFERYQEKEKAKRRYQRKKKEDLPKVKDKTISKRKQKTGLTTRNKI